MPPLKPHPRISPFQFQIAGPAGTTAGIAVPLVDEAGAVHVIEFPMAAPVLTDLAARLAAAAAQIQREAVGLSTDFHAKSHDDASQVVEKIEATTNS